MFGLSTLWRFTRAFDSFLSQATMVGRTRGVCRSAEGGGHFFALGATQIQNTLKNAPGADFFSKWEKTALEQLFGNFFLILNCVRSEHIKQNGPPNRNVKTPWIKPTKAKEKIIQRLNGRQLRSFVSHSLTKRACPADLVRPDKHAYSLWKNLPPPSTCTTTDFCD